MSIRVKIENETSKTSISDNLALRYEKRVEAETRTSHHRNLIMQRSLAPQELVNLGIDRALAPPLYNWVKQESVDTKGQRAEGGEGDNQNAVSAVQHSHS